MPLELGQSESQTLYSQGDMFYIEVDGGTVYINYNHPYVNRGYLHHPAFAGCIDNNNIYYGDFLIDLQRDLLIVFEKYPEHEFIDTSDPSYILDNSD